VNERLGDVASASPFCLALTAGRVPAARAIALCSISADEIDTCCLKMTRTCAHADGELVVVLIVNARELHWRYSGGVEIDCLVSARVDSCA